MKSKGCKAVCDSRFRQSVWVGATLVLTSVPSRVWVRGDTVLDSSGGPKVTLITGGLNGSTTFVATQWMRVLSPSPVPYSAPLGDRPQFPDLDTARPLAYPRNCFRGLRPSTPLVTTGFLSSAPTPVSSRATFVLVTRRGTTLLMRQARYNSSQKGIPLMSSPPRPRVYERSRRLIAEALPP